MSFNTDLLLKDIKRCNKKLFHADKISNTSFDLLMRSFEFSDKGILKEEYEASEYVALIYEILGWNDNSYFDVINSFWTTFSWLMHSQFDYDIAPAGNVKIYKKHNYNYDSFPEKYNKGNGKIKNEVFKLRESQCSIMYFASVCHCVANFMPCPDVNFNSVKGVLSDVRDYFPLMVEKIQSCIDGERCLEYHVEGRIEKISIEQLYSWKKWLIENREKYCLEEYYTIDSIEDEVRLKGVPLFTNQTLDYPCPQNKMEVIECINEMIQRIEHRAKTIIERYNQAM